ncbi:hypothetical protein IFO70_26120 [Phormidium tenue FACHB-886]|nr:hypothetical protein [Phormidium tenue FACHB-886]
MTPSDPPEKIPLREELQQQIMHLSLKDKEILLGWLKAMIKEHKQQTSPEQIPLKKGREVVETLHTGTTMYRLEKVKCGKKKCKCTKGNLHGPYWYSYHWNGKKLTSSYIGKKLDEEAAAEIENENPPET